MVKLKQYFRTKSFEESEEKAALPKHETQIHKNSAKL
jgi:hypothetical protein